MTNVTARLPKKKVIEGLSRLSFIEIREVMDSLIQRRLFTPPSPDDLHKEASKIIKRGKLTPKVVEEAVKWAKAQK